MSTHDSIWFLEVLERTLDEGLIQEGQVRVTVPLLGIDVASVDFWAFVASCEKYLNYAHALEQVAEDAPLVNTVAADGLPTAPDGDNVVESDPTPAADAMPLLS
jgi:hypothetical protein